jgi:hypothetical protein
VGAAASGAAKLRARGRVAAAGEHEGRRGDLGEAVGGVVVEEGVQVGLQVLGRLLVREGTPWMNWATVPSLWARAV